MDILVHLGAHKTASSHISHVLRGARKELEGSGTYFWDNSTFRPEFTNKIKVWERPNSPVFKVKSLLSPDRYSNRSALNFLHSFLDKTIKNFKKVIISEENLLGSTESIFKTDQIYGLTPSRLRTIGEFFKSYPTRYCIAIRNPSTFLPSIYCEALRHHEFRPFEEIFKGRPFDELSWVPLVSSLRERLPGEDLTVWTYEDYAAEKRFVIEWLTAMDTAGWNLQEHLTRRPRLSAGAVERIAADRDVLEESSERKERIEEIVASRPVSRSDPKFQPFSPQAIEYMTTRYREDLAVISRMPGVKVLKRTEAL